MKPTIYIETIIEELHRIREEHAAKFNYDLRAIVRDFQKQQINGKKKVVSFVSKKKDVHADVLVAEI